MKILLIGAGNMGGAMIDGLLSYDLEIVQSNDEKRAVLQEKYPQIKFYKQAPNIDDYVVILAIKPQSFKAFSLQGRAIALISVMAGISLEALHKISANSYIRALPNIAALVKESATVVTGDDDFKSHSCEILQSIGKTFWVANEDLLESFSPLAGCSIAWLSVVAESLTDASVQCGCSRQIAAQVAAQVFLGLAKTMEKTKPSDIKDMVTSPKGTTIYGLEKIEEGAVRNSFFKATMAAFNRAKQLV